jgi:hypothetical protein
MHEIYKVKNGGSVWIGDDNDYLKIATNPKWRSCRMCKFGPGGHKETLGYQTQAAPKGKNYLHVEKDNRVAINILDMDDPNMIPWECIKYAIDYAKANLDEGYNILIACNSGHSRGPTTGLLFLRSIGDLPYHFVKAEHVYKTLYPKYDPGMGMRQVARMHWYELDNREL